MAKPSQATNGNTSSLMVRMDEESKTVLAQAAGLRKISVSDYVRLVTVSQAKKEVSADLDRTIVLTPDEQLAFWTALDSPPPLTPGQKKLGKIMRGET